MGIAEQIGLRPYTGGDVVCRPAKAHAVALVKQPSAEAALVARVRELEDEVARLKRELASRPLPDAVTPVTLSGNVSGNAMGNAGNAPLTPAEKQRRYRERKKALA